MKRMIDMGLPVKTCPVCGRDFVPAPQHVFRTPNRTAYVCGYRCARKAEQDKREAEKMMSIFWCREAGEDCGLYVVAMTRGKAKRIFGKEMDCRYVDVLSKLVKRGATELVAGVIEVGSPLLEKYGLHYDEVEV